MAALRDAGLTRLIGVAPGPANGFTLDVIRCIERFGDRIDWAMLILNPLEPWPGELPLEAAARHDVKRDHPRRRLRRAAVGRSGAADADGRARPPRGSGPTAGSRPGSRSSTRMRPIAERAGLTPIQLACAWNLSHPAVACCAPTLIQEAGADARPDRGQAGRACGAYRGPSCRRRTLAAIREIGDNTGSMRLKGANPEHEGPEAPDRWPLSDELAGVADRWNLDPQRTLTYAG